ncbi:MAG: ribonuclease III [Ruminococcaceae bacterium]|nr:ribonuclease III [Oscillospiraceae bacterium]
MEENKLREISAAALAYLGDSVIEIRVREHLVNEGYSSSARLNERALDFVRAPMQAKAMEKLLPLLSEEEEAVFRRGRNIGHTAKPRSSTIAEYRSATGMEALFGYLHLKGELGRIDELFALAYDIENK